MHDIEWAGAALRGHDLNLLVVLLALLEARSVTAAAKRVSLSPSATSHALSRLRAAFDDPLLVRQGAAMVPTPRGEVLAPLLREVLAGVGGLYQQQVAFDPEHSRRRFTVAAADLAAPLVPGVMQAVARQAPEVSLSWVGPLARPDALATGQVDVALRAAPSRPDAAWVAERVGAVRFAVFSRSDHPFVQRPDRATWCAHPHVLVSTPHPGPGFVAEVVSAMGLTRRVGLVVPTFLLALHTVAEAPLLFTAPDALARPTARTLGLVATTLPLDVGEVAVEVAWHRRVDADPGHRWFRALLGDVVRRALHAPSSR
ncbi:MAG: LysR family transcriptional regulator [Myxococcales bacterium]|nr:LysR family transcriptional regulator [Myxococcales bacterium]